MSLKEKHNAHIAQLSCTLVCLEPSALFWDNIRGFKPEYGTTCLRIADVKTVSFSFSGCFFFLLSSYPHSFPATSVFLYWLFFCFLCASFASPQLMFQCFKSTCIKKKTTTTKQKDFLRLWQGSLNNDYV